MSRRPQKSAPFHLVSPACEYSVQPSSGRQPQACTAGAFLTEPLLSPCMCLQPAPPCPYSLSRECVCACVCRVCESRCMCVLVRAQTWVLGFLPSTLFEIRSQVANHCMQQASWPVAFLKSCLCLLRVESWSHRLSSFMWVLGVWTL